MNEANAIGGLAMDLANAARMLTPRSLTPGPASPGDPSGFGPAVVVGAAQAPSILVIYTASGQRQGGGESPPAPNPRLVPPVVDSTGANIPAPLRYDRLGREVLQITLVGRDDGGPNAYTIGYRLLI